MSSLVVLCLLVLSATTRRLTCPLQKQGKLCRSTLASQWNPKPSLAHVHLHWYYNMKGIYAGVFKCETWLVQAYTKQLGSCVCLHICCEYWLFLNKLDLLKTQRNTLSLLAACSTFTTQHSVLAPTSKPTPLCLWTTTEPSYKVAHLRMDCFQKMLRCRLLQQLQGNNEHRPAESLLSEGDAQETPSLRMEWRSWGFWWEVLVVIQFIAHPKACLLLNVPHMGYQTRPT